MWAKSIVYWRPNQASVRVSVAFTWHLPLARKLCQAYMNDGQTVLAGGPAVSLMPDYLADVASCGGDLPSLHRHNPNATFTTRGCTRQCPFCAVPKIEGEFRELTDWEPAPIVCDNNLLASSRKHFNRVVDRLKPHKGVDFNQGLDVRLLKPWHLERLTELRLVQIRFAWDWTSMESVVMDAIDRTLAAGIPKGRIRVYLLIGYEDTPEDALYRLETLRNKGIRANPMRYQPLDELVKNSYVAPNWTAKELSRMMRYWSRQNWLSKVPYEEYRRDRRGEMTKILEIESCEDCRWGKGILCDNPIFPNGTFIPQIRYNLADQVKALPTWCPLPDRMQASE